ncbi:MAG: hypothetical protein Q7K34_03395 [archaeon]|nr:hypothetical protein [archaeon]
MSGVFSVPLPVFEAGTAKGRILSVLGKRFPLTAKQVFSELRKEFGVNTSYQATHKLLNQLIEENTVIKNGHQYSLNRDWIVKVKKLGSSLEDYYIKNSGQNYLEELEKHGTVNVSLTGIKETASFLINGFFRLPNPGKKPGICLWRNVYSIIGLSEDHYDGLKETLPNWHAVSSENNPLDQMFAQTLSKYGMHVKLGVKEVATALNDTFVAGDYVGTIWFPPAFRELWDKQNKAPAKINEFDLQHHLEMMTEEKAAINMVITKNPILAEQIREKYMTHFKGGK